MLSIESENTSEASEVLIVEDDDLIREAVRELLEFEGIRALTAENGQQALNLLRESSSPPALILLDLMMPVLDGWSFLEERSRDARLSEIPVVVVTAVSDDKLKEVSADGVIKKPFDFKELVSSIRSYLH
ncbi:MAG TPA: response regulator transcription factor [Blastocatellia bacterium]|nr:response regulator transcription factor [Blastocatellia bacterium]